MDLLEIHSRFLNLINKSQGAYYPPQVIDEWLDMGSLATFDTYYLEFAKSQRINDALAPFKKKFTFTLATTPGGVVTVPTDYFDAIRMSIIVQTADTPPKVLTRPCPRLNDDEITARLNSQIKPPTVMWPFMETIQNWNIQLYPQQPMAGTLAYLKRPATPNFVYTVVGGVIVYNSGTSTQLEWADKNIDEILNLAIQFSGVNTRETDLVTYGMQKQTQDVTSPVKS